MRAVQRRWICAAVCAATVLGCTSDATTGAAPTAPPPVVGPLRPSEPFGVTSVTLESPSGGVALAVPVYDAYVPAARSRGLMHRKRLPRHTGMVFRFPGPRTGGFYMKDTLIPLSIAFFDAGGTVVDVLDMPPCKAEPCPTYTPRTSYEGALEVNRGFFDQVGLERGWRIELPPGLPRPK